MKSCDNKYALIRVLHGAPISEIVDIYINGSLFFNHLFFTEFTPYVYVPKGDYEITVFRTMTKENPLLRQNISVTDDGLITIAITGIEEDLQLIKVLEYKEEATFPNSNIRFVHLSPNAKAVNILLDNDILFSNLNFREITEYKDIESAIYRIDIESAKSNRILRSNQVAINRNRVYTFYILGYLANIQVFQSLDGATFITPVVRKIQPRV